MGIQMLMQLIEANVETPDSEKDLLLLNIELDRFREVYYPNSYIEKALRFQRTIEEKYTQRQEEQRAQEDIKTQRDIVGQESIREDANALNQSQKLMLSAIVTSNKNEETPNGAQTFDIEKSVAQEGPESQNESEKQKASTNLNKSQTAMTVEQQQVQNDVLKKIVFAKEWAVILFKLGIGFYFVAQGVSNKNEYMSPQTHHLNSFLIFTSFFMMTEATKDIFDYFTGKEIDRQVKNNDFTPQSLRKSRLYQQANAALFCGFFIYGFYQVGYYSDADFTVQTEFANAEQYLFNLLRANGTYDASHRYNYTQSQVDATELENDMQSEYLLFSLLVLLTCVKCILQSIYPPYLRNPFKKINKEDSGSNAALLYSLVYGFGVNLASLILVYKLSSVSFREMKEKEQEIGQQESYQLSQMTGLQFSCGAENAFLFITYIDALVDDIPVLFALVYKLCMRCKEKIIKMFANSVKPQAEVPVDPLTDFDERLVRWFIAVLNFIFLSNMAIFLFEFLYTDTIYKKFEVVNCKQSTLFLFYLSLNLAGADNCFDACILAIVIFRSGINPLSVCKKPQRLETTSQSDSEKQQQNQAKVQQPQQQEEEIDVESFSH
eukprot:403366159